MNLLSLQYEYFFWKMVSLCPFVTVGIESIIAIINGFPLKINKELLKYVVNEDAHEQVKLRGGENRIRDSS